MATISALDMTQVWAQMGPIVNWVLPAVFLGIAFRFAPKLLGTLRRGSH